MTDSRHSNRLRGGSLLHPPVGAGGQPAGSGFPHSRSACPRLPPWQPRLLHALRPEPDGSSAYIGLLGANIINFILTGGVLLAAFHPARRRPLQQR